MSELKNIYLFYGEDNYTSLEKTKAWLSVFKTKYPEGAVVKIDADELKNDDLLKNIDSSCNTGSLFEKIKLVLIKRLWHKEITDETRLNILKIITKVTDKTFVLIWHNDKISNLDETLKGLARLDNAKAENFPKPQDRLAFTNWLNQRLKAKKIFLNRNDFEKLADLLGRNFIVKDRGNIILPFEIGEMELVIDSLKLIEGQSNFSQHIEKLITNKVNLIVFELIESLVRQDLQKSIWALDKLLANNAPEAIFSTITWQYRTTLKIYSGLGEKMTEKEIAQKMKLSPFVVKKNLPLATKLTLTDIKKFYELLLKYDLKAKSGYDSIWQLEELIIQLCQKE